MPPQAFTVHASITMPIMLMILGGVVEHIINTILLLL